MKTIKIETTLSVFDTLSDTPNDIQNLMKVATEAMEKAYAPYSNFKVGAAILLENDKIVSGNNQENASYPSGLCAERTAIYYAGAQFPDVKMVKMAIIATSEAKPTTSPIPPCGACRQAIAEYEVKQDTPIEIYFMGLTGQVYKSNSIANLLPLIFDKSNL